MDRPIWLALSGLNRVNVADRSARDSTRSLRVIAVTVHPETSSPGRTPMIRSAASVAMYARAPCGPTTTPNSATPGGGKGKGCGARSTRAAMAAGAGGAFGRRFDENTGRSRVLDSRSSGTPATGLPETAGISTSVAASGIARTNALPVWSALAICAQAVEPCSATAATTSSWRHDVRSIRSPGMIGTGPMPCTVPRCSGFGGGRVMAGAT